jgi:hypothetical protein
MLCPVLACHPSGTILLMPAAKPLTAEEYAKLEFEDFPDWDYMPGGEEDPCEYEKPSDWGWLDGRLVALDYSAPAIPFGDDDRRPPQPIRSSSR